MKKKAKKVIRKNSVTVTLKSDFNKCVGAIKKFKGIDNDNLFYSFEPLPDMKHWK